MKTATITYHASHNYGSMLQAYALQRTIMKLGYENEIINLRTERQKKLYSKPFEFTRPFIRQMLHNVLCLPYRNALEKKYNLFEQFLVENLLLTREYSSMEDIKKDDLDYDCFIAGGDQIWNTAPIDFDWSFYLPFTAHKKISYAVSMGPKAEQQVASRTEIKEYLSKFAHISVREESTKKIVESLTENGAMINLDPVLLLSKDEWLTKIDSKPLIYDDYILVYVPGGYREDVFGMSEIVAHKVGMNVYTTLFSRKLLFRKCIKKYFAVGPWEFLNLLANAKLVISGSYHAVIFSALFKKPFIAVNGMNDGRMKTFLENTGLTYRAMSQNDFESNSDDLFVCDFIKSANYLNAERINSLSYLKNAIEND